MRDRGRATERERERKKERGAERKKEDYGWVGGSVKVRIGF